MKHRYALETEHLLMVPLSITGSESFRLLRNREDNRNWFIYKKIISQEEQEQWYQKYLLNKNDYMFEIYAKDNVELFLGAASVYDVNEQKKKAEIGRIIIDKHIAESKGYGAEVVNGLINISFNLLNLDMIYANIYEDNLASIKTFQRAGLKVKDRKTDIDGKIILYLEKSRLG